MLEVEGPVGDVLWGALLLGVVTRAQLLCLDLGGSLALLLSSSTQWGQGMLLLLLGQPGVGSNVGSLADRGAADAVATSVASLGCTPSVAVRRQVLVELIDVEAPHVGDDVGAQLTNVHSSKVDIELPTGALLNGAPLSLHVNFAGREIRLGGSWGRWWALGLTWWEESKNLRLDWVTQSSNSWFEPK